jgi:hypothetical protein
MSSWPAQALWPPGLAVHMWHPRIWDLHFWRGSDGVAVVSFANPHAQKGGLDLPTDAFLQIVNGRRQSLPPPRNVTWEFHQ